MLRELVQSLGIAPRVRTKSAIASTYRLRYGGSRATPTAPVNPGPAGGVTAVTPGSHRRDAVVVVRRAGQARAADQISTGKTVSFSTRVTGSRTLQESGCVVLRPEQQRWLKWLERTRPGADVTYLITKTPPEDGAVVASPCCFSVAVYPMACTPELIGSTLV